MVISWAQIVVWLIVGLIGGTLAGVVVRWQRDGFGLWSNLGIGLVGALVGGLLFRLFNILPGLDAISISMRDVVSAVLGSILFLAALWAWHRYRGSPL
ncbi:MAG TPA: GlsB/YeaQ/YmgE family stress response membrane protein [Hyphomicrobium sp.]|jgi:uncharacterized membrane protein YeaQ/YmgE (transglycosylase-associated protein family)